jgi:hypothetical protein
MEPGRSLNIVRRSGSGHGGTAPQTVIEKHQVADHSQVPEAVGDFNGLPACLPACLGAKQGFSPLRPYAPPRLCSCSNCDTYYTAKPVSSRDVMRRPRNAERKAECILRRILGSTLFLGGLDTLDVEGWVAHAPSRTCSCGSSRSLVEHDSDGSLKSNTVRVGQKPPRYMNLSESSEMAVKTSTNSDRQAPYVSRHGERERVGHGEAPASDRKTGAIYAAAVRVKNIRRRHTPIVAPCRRGLWVT